MSDDWCHFFFTYIHCLLTSLHVGENKIQRSGQLLELIKNWNFKVWKLIYSNIHLFGFFFINEINFFYIYIYCSLPSLHVGENKIQRFTCLLKLIISKFRSIFIQMYVNIYKKKFFFYIYTFGSRYPLTYWKLIKAEVSKFGNTFIRIYYIFLLLI